MNPLTPERARVLHAVARQHGTPCYVYDAATIRERVAQLRAFDVIRYAQKACSNVHILRLLREAGVCVDAVSLGEVERARVAGFDPRSEPAGVVYAADVFAGGALERVIELDVPVNAGSIDMLDQLGARRPGHRVWLRLNPGFGHGHSRKTNTGGESSKHGIWYEQLPDALRSIDAHRLELVGLHMHIGSGADPEHLAQVANAMVEQVRMLGRDLRGISAGGGLPIPYRSTDATLDVAAFFARWDAARRDIERQLGHPSSRAVEPGRFLVADAGWLIAEVRATKTMGKNSFVLVDAGFDNLVRPAMYGSYHGISAIRADGSPAGGRRTPSVVGGPLCESGDVFTQEDGGVVVPRELPQVRVGDLLVFHDAGAYGAAMASNYNTRTLAPEVLLDAGEARLIRRRQTLEELLALEQV